MAGEANGTLPVSVVSDAVATAGMGDEEAQAKLTIEAAVKAAMKQFDDDQKFDKPIRVQIRKDRSYASGEAQATWAVSTNMIGSAIDVLVAILYARDPDVSVRPAPQVDPPIDPATGIVPPQPERKRNEDMAKSLELVLSTLWKKGMLKARMRRVIRSILSASHGWLKVLPACSKQPDPLAQNEYNTLQANVESVAAQITALQAGQTLSGITASEEDLKVQQSQLQTSMEALSGRLEVDVYYGFTFDVVKPENMQVGTDVELLEEYLESDSITEIMYFPHDQLRAKFPDLTDKELQTAEKWYRKRPKNANQGESAKDSLEGDMIARMYPAQGADDDNYTTAGQEDGGRPLAKVLEKWNKADNHIYTMIKGVKTWARAPYQPSWASCRWYPYFYFSLNEVDGQRCPQSLSSRGAKLQDEYASVRSNLRITRRRSIPGTLVDASALSDEELDKIQKGVIAEITPLKTTQPGQDFGKLFASKPVPSIDMRLYDTTPIVYDLERTFGVQEAQQQVSSTEITATQAQIQQTGLNTRTSTWRDTIETTMTEMAQYCAEIALQKIPPQEAAKIAGPAVYWPTGLALEDLVSLVEVTIAAGTTGKPRNMGDREAWSAIMPQLKELAVQVFQLRQDPNAAPLAAALEEQIIETMRRFGEEGDVSRFIPQAPMLPQLPPAMPGEVPPPGLPPDGMAPAAGPPGAPPPPTQAGIEANGLQPTV